MKVEITISIEADLLEQVNHFATDECSRSKLFEEALQQYLSRLEWRKKHEMSDEEEIEKINRYVEDHGDEVRENLRFQAELMLEALDETRRTVSS